LYSFEANGFSGELEPFTYTFFYTRENDNMEVVIGAANLYGPSTVDYLPSGILTIGVDVSNAIGEVTRVTRVIKVLDDQSSSSWKSNTLTLNNAQLSGNINTAVSVVRIMSDMLNESPVDITNRPLLDERILHRENLTNILADNLLSVDVLQVAQTLVCLTRDTYKREHLLFLLL
jgi:hypothetical protein